MLEDGPWEVIIVGAGPVGLALAKGLGRDGRRVLVLESEDALSEHSKALTLWPGSQEVLDRLGLMPCFERNSLVLGALSLHDADRRDRILLHLPLHELRYETSFPRLLVLPQSRTERLLYESLAEEPSVTVRFSAEAVALVDSPAGARIEYASDGERSAATARFVVGCDGAHSFVRDQLEFGLEGATFPFRAGLADVRIPASDGLPGPRLSTRLRPCVGIPLGTDLWRVIIVLDQAARLDEAAIKAAVRNLFGSVTYELLWQSDFRLHRRTADQFARGNAVLAGDAAHLNSPVGGQGMNAGIQDSEILRAAIGRALREDSCAAIAEYASARKATIQHGVNRNTGRLTSLLFLRRGKYFKHVVRGLDRLLRVAPIRRRFLRGVAMLPAANETSD